MAHVEPGCDGLTPIEIVVGIGERQIRTMSVQVRPGATVADVLAALRVSTIEPVILQQLDTATLRDVAIWGQRRRLDWVVQPGDRVEILRPLTVDPMQARRRRHAARQRQNTARQAT